MKLRILTTLVLAGLPVLTNAGCRMNGGYPGERDTHSQIVKAKEYFEFYYARSVTSLGQLEEQSTSSSTLFSLVQPFRDVLSDHAEAMIRVQDRVAALSPATSYRELNRMLGALTSERTVFEDRYSVLFDFIAWEDGHNSIKSAQMRDVSYAVFPPEYRTRSFLRRLHGDAQNTEPR